MAKHVERIYAFDFETTTIDVNKYDEQSEYHEAVKNGQALVYSYAIATKYQNQTWITDGISLDSFMDNVLQLKEYSILYAHNGAKFDFHFILKWLSDNGFTRYIYLNEKINEFDLSDIEEYGEIDGVEITSDKRKISFGEYTATIDDTHKIMEITIAVPAKIGDDHVIVKFRDSNLMSVGSIASYGKTLNKHYNTDIWSKKDLDGGYTREELYSDYEEFLNDGNEREYLQQDVVILLEYLYLLNESLPFYKWKMTAASTAYNIWKYEFFGPKLLERAIETKWIKEVKKNDEYSQYTIGDGKKELKRIAVIEMLVNSEIPTKWLSAHTINFMENNYETLEEAKGGGLTMANPDHAGIVKENILYVDENSAYPGVMVNKMYPIGKPTTDLTAADRPDYKSLYRVNIKKVENKHGLPFIGVEDGDSRTYPKVVKYKNIVLTDEELERFKKYYTGKYTVEFMCAFRAVPGEYYFGDYISFFYKMKEEASKKKDEGAKNYAKLMLNSIWGKTIQSPVRESKIFTNDEDNLWISYTQRGLPQYYFPIGIWTAAHGRMALVDAVGENFESVNYLDTDSLSIILDDKIDINDDEEIANWMRYKFPNIELHPTKLGAWDIEKKIKWQVCRRAKQRFEETIDGKKVLTFAGLNLKQSVVDELTIDEFLTGKTGFRQLRPFRSVTGLILEEYDKQILPIWEYGLSESYWFKNEEEFRAGRPADYMKKNKLSEEEINEIRRQRIADL